MKEWLRQHQDYVPYGLDPTNSTSHQLRDGLKRLGWSVRETDSQVQLVPPDSSNSECVIAAVLGDEGGDSEAGEPETVFALEYQLRDFIAQISVQFLSKANACIYTLIRPVVMESSFRRL